MKPLLTLGLGIISLATQAQLTVQSGATLFIDAGASVTVQGDLVSNANITGTGKIIMKGTALQNLNMNGFTIPNLDIDNTNNVLLGGETKVSGVLNFVNGKLQLGNYNFVLAGSGSHTGAGAGKFAETNGTGEFRDEVSAVGSVTLPVGVGADYNPVTFQLAGNTFSSAYVGARAVSGGHPAKHPRSSDYLNHYWALSQSGVTGGTITTTGTYVDGADVTGTESLMNAMTYNGSAWSLGTSIDNGTNTVTAPMSGASSQLYAMNKFVLVTPKVFLQGAYNSGTGLMSTNLRTAPTLIPTDDPYRNATYSSFFTHVNNSASETVSSSVFNDQANPENNIVDWVFVELRSISSPTSAPVVQTRSVLLQSDGDLVDVDGVSPVYFKNVDGGNYAVSVRHRNHLGISSNPANPIALGLANSNYDFTTAAGSGIFGTASQNYAVINNKNVLFAGNVFLNTTSNYLGVNTDRAQILTVMANAGGAPTPARTMGSASDYLTYGIGDINMDRRVDYLGISPDRSFLLSTVLGGVPNPIPAKTQTLPN
jgi:hypothetical protein